jgi:tRNA (cmo5U34)-methyltransferase
MNPSTGFNEDRTKGYDERVRQHIVGYEILHALTETILSAAFPAEADLLIAGIGTGMEVREWAPKHKEWRFVGVDPSEPMIALAAEKLKAAGLSNRVRLTVGTVESIPEGTLFDAATLLLVLHFVPDNGEKEALLTAIAARLKPGATLILATLFGDPATTRYKRMMSLTKAWALAHGMESPKAEELFSPTRTDLHVVPEDRIKDLFRYAGFIDVTRVYQAFAIGVWSARTSRPLK